jgi:hypothetical protein
MHFYSTARHRIGIAIRIDHRRICRPFIPIFIMALVFTLFSSDSHAQVVIQDTITIDQIALQSAMPNVQFGPPSPLPAISIPPVECGNITVDLEEWFGEEFVFFDRIGGVLNIDAPQYWEYGWPKFSLARILRSHGELIRYTLLVYGMDGSVAFEFPLYQWDLSYIFHPDTTVVLSIPYMAWEPLRFRMHVEIFRGTLDAPHLEVVYAPAPFDTIYCYDANGALADSALVRGTDFERKSLVFRSDVWPGSGVGCWNTIDEANYYSITQVERDSSAIGELPDETRPPFSPVSIAIEQPGLYSFRILSGNKLANDDLRILSPYSDILLTNVQSHIGDTLLLGPFESGDVVQFGIVSSAPYFTGQTMFPCVQQYELIADMWFENWIDLRFNELYARFSPEISPPSELRMEADPDPVVHTDTSQITLYAVDESGEFIPLDDSYMFAIYILEGEQYGTLLYQGHRDDYAVTPVVGGRSDVVYYIADGVEPEDTVVVVFGLDAFRDSGGDILLSIQDGEYKSRHLMTPGTEFVIQAEQSEKKTVSPPEMADRTDYDATPHSLPSPPVAAQSSLPPFLDGTGVLRVVGGDACSLATVPCTNEQLQPRQFDRVNDIRTFADGDIFNWIDNEGNAQSIAVQGCDYRINPGEIRLGYTATVYGFPLDPPRKYTTFSDLVFLTCFYEDEGRWILNMNNFYIPILRTLCNIDQFIHLGDGTNHVLLGQYIINYRTYELVRDELAKFWIPGPYSNIGIKPTYVYDVGILAHENEHVNQQVTEIESEMTSVFHTMYNLDITKEGFPCTETVLSEWYPSGLIRGELGGVVNRINRVRPGEEKNLRELTADRVAEPVYRLIQERIEEWARTQPWWVD